MHKLRPWTARPRRSRIALVAAALAASVTLAACGDDEGDDEAAVQEIEEVVVAYGDSEGAEACDFLSASALDQLGGESGCARQFESVGAAELQVTDVTVDGQSATAQVTNTGEQGSDFQLELVNEEDEWRISVFPGLETIAPAGEPPPAEGEEGETDTEGETTAPEEETTAPEEQTTP